MQDVLDEMAGSVTQRKADAKTVLTPTRGEKQGLPEVDAVFLTNEAVMDVSRDLRRQAQLLIDVADGLDKITGTPEPTDTRAQAHNERVVQERAADKAHAIREEAKFAAAFAAKAEAAQAATFGDAPVPAGWVCPEHGDKALVTKTSRKGRSYLSCTKCPQFERAE
jgi:hypothetical protein